MADDARSGRPDPLTGAATDANDQAMAQIDRLVRDRIADALEPFHRRVGDLARRVADLEAVAPRPPADDPAARS